MMLMINMAMTDLAHTQHEVVLNGELYWGIIIGAAIVAGSWYFYSIASVAKTLIILVFKPCQ